MFKKGIKANSGLVGDVFKMDQFYRDPIFKIIKGKIKEREFDLRLLAFSPKADA